jgi:hypothetical protein
VLLSGPVFVQLPSQRVENRCVHFGHKKQQDCAACGALFSKGAVDIMLIPIMV